ncbi:DUF4349 domain-containing protein [Dethiobacter alkaliphilus]|uniref:DUF4349 domain-containing protein n=1 Tax=Dethiobacter alkaliphilus AHT 1 TaxID=555088 RepID=C0GEP0_DETAL|nr:DUF4349 domain-containing protein [Dethiobacter alkaliphilus]EEG78072.1 conserved hypothetical protein [Dethiobacter alkaliphilus AHT 1]
MFGKKFLGLFLLLLLLMFMLTACGAVREQAGRGYDDAASPEELNSRAAMEEQYGEDSDGAGDVQHIIRTADLSLDVENLDNVLGEVRQIVQQAGGFIAESSVYGAEENRRSSLTLRIPANQMDDVLAEIDSLGKQTHKSTGGRDVTLQYVDLEARIRNLQRQEERLLDILQDADTVEEILQVEQELGRIRGELESLTAEFRYLSDRVDYATIHVSLRQTPTASPTITGTGLQGVWQRGVAGLINSVNAMVTGLGNFLVFLLTALPYLLFFAVVGVPVSLLIRRFAGNRPRTPDA